MIGRPGTNDALQVALDEIYFPDSLVLTDLRPKGVILVLSFFREYFIGDLFLGKFILLHEKAIRTKGLNE